MLNREREKVLKFETILHSDCFTGTFNSFLKDTETRNKESIMNMQKSLN